ncbi:MAG: hypothetical protein V1802_01365 [Candidatus Aenigmatarchaeota archaeon]
MTYNHVSAKNLTSEELRASKIPDECLAAVWVEFRSKADKRYQAVHVRRHSTGPYILLCGLDKNLLDFEYVERIVANETYGNQQLHINDRSDDICDVIRLTKKPTQAKVAEVIEKYKTHFSDVTIPEAYFFDVRKSVYENPGLPEEKLTFEGMHILF